jgi:hypothetical protein
MYIMIIFVEWKNTDCHAKYWNGVQQFAGEETDDKSGVSM